MGNFVTTTRYQPQRPKVLVIACSDGRLQEATDEFLAHQGFQDYDRLFAPGGPGALATSGIEYIRSSQFHRECEFLIAAHQVQDVILLFHGPAEDGPEQALCADYLRKRPGASRDDIQRLQQSDAQEILRMGFSWHRSVRVWIYRAEVRADGTVQFVRLQTV